MKKRVNMRHYFLFSELCSTIVTKSTPDPQRIVQPKTGTGVARLRTRAAGSCRVAGSEASASYSKGWLSILSPHICANRYDRAGFKAIKGAYKAITLRKAVTELDKTTSHRGSPLRDRKWDFSIAFGCAVSWPT